MLSLLPVFREIGTHYFINDEIIPVTYIERGSSRKKRYIRSLLPLVLQVAARRGQRWAYPFKMTPEKKDKCSETKLTFAAETYCIHGARKYHQDLGLTELTEGCQAEGTYSRCIVLTCEPTCTAM